MVVQPTEFLQDQSQIFILNERHYCFLKTETGRATSNYSLLYNGVAKTQPH